MNNNQTSPLFSSAETKCASQVVYEQIYDKIVSGELRPGDRLPAERILVEQFKRSRPVIREALRMLQQDGLIKIEVGSAGGAVIQSISIESVEAPLKKLIDIGAIGLRELVDYRAVNDMGCAELAVKYHTGEDIKLLLDNLEEYKAAAESNNSEKIRIIDREHHALLANSTHNPIAIAVNNVISDSVVSMFWGLADKLDESNIRDINTRAYETHKAVVDSVIADDVESAKLYMKVAVDLFYDTVQPLLEEESSDF